MLAEQQPQSERLAYTYACMLGMHAEGFNTDFGHCTFHFMSRHTPQERFWTKLCQPLGNVHVCLMPMLDGKPGIPLTGDPAKRGRVCRCGCTLWPLALNAGRLLGAPALLLLFAADLASSRNCKMSLLGATCNMSFESEGQLLNCNVAVQSTARACKSSQGSLCQHGPWLCLGPSHYRREALVQ